MVSIILNKKSLVDHVLLMTFVSSINFINDKLQPPFEDSCGQTTFFFHIGPEIFWPQ